MQSDGRILSRGCPTTHQSVGTMAYSPYLLYSPWIRCSLVMNGVDVVWKISDLDYHMDGDGIPIYEWGAICFIIKKVPNII